MQSKSTIPATVLRFLSPKNLWQLFQWAFPSGAAIVTGWAAYLASLPLAVTIFLTLASAACALVIAVESQKIIREHSVFQNLIYTRTELLPCLPNREANTISMIFKCWLENASETKTIYFKLRRVHVVLQGRANPDPQLNEQVTALQPKRAQPFQTAAVHGLNVGDQIAGRIEIEILYGPNPDNLKYLLDYRISPAITTDAIDDKRATFTFVGPVKKCEHTRTN